MFIEHFRVVRVAFLVLLINCFCTVVDSILFARTRCYFRFVLLRYDPEKLEKYPLYFREDSILSLAQTGVWTGPESIEEYVRFLGDAPYWNVDTNQTSTKIAFDKYNEETGNCEFYAFVDLFLIANSEFPSSKVDFSSLVMFKLLFNLNDRYIKEQSVYFSTPFFAFLSKTYIGSSETVDFICSVINGPCKSLIPEPNNCKAELSNRVEYHGQNYNADGDSISCRGIHAVMARNNSKMHCPHIALEPTEGTSFLKKQCLQYF